MKERESDRLVLNKKKIVQNQWKNNGNAIFKKKKIPVLVKCEMKS